MLVTLCTVLQISLSIGRLDIALKRLVFALAAAI